MAAATTTAARSLMQAPPRASTRHAAKNPRSRSDMRARNSRSSLANVKTGTPVVGRATGGS
eukprot:4519459-Pleurochrysis_carterae.AAC.1